MKIKTIEQAKELGLIAISYPNGYGEYEDVDGYYHLFRDGEELLPEIKKLDTTLEDNGDGEYLDTNNEGQIIKNDNIIKELEKKLEIANKIIDRNIARVIGHISDKPAIEMYDNTDNGKEEIIRTVPKEQYDYIKELKENEN